MSAAAIPIYNMLIARGVSEKEARKSAEDTAAEVLQTSKTETVEAAKTEAAEIAKTVAQAEAVKVVAQSEEKAKIQFVSRTEYHERDKTLATRADIAEVNRRMDAGFAELRAAIVETNRRIDRIEQRMDALYRLVVGLLIIALGGAGALIAAAVKFIFFGI